MLAFAWPWESDGDGNRALVGRLGASLCAGIGGHAGSAQFDDLHFAYRPLRSTAALSRAWRPARLPSGRLAAFHGYFDNAAEIAAELGTDSGNAAQLYGLAVEQWGDQTEQRVVGEYCALIADPREFRLRLSRSPLRAPPLCYFHDERLVAVASVPRALFAAGVQRRLNERHVADSTLINFSNQESSWFEDVHRVPLGSVVDLERGRQRILRKVYDLLAMPDVRMASDAEYIKRASELLDQAVGVCLTGFKRPGVALSSGLDSPQVACRALAALPAGQTLPTFTFHPEPGFDGRCEAGKLGDERPLVEAFAAMHPGLEPHFTSNAGYEHDYRWDEFFHLMGGAPSGLCNMYVFHGLFSGAAKQGCDVLLHAEWGNCTFSDAGGWGFVEYLLKGRWRQLWLALARQPNQHRSILWRFFARIILPLLPNWLWRLVRKIAQPRRKYLVELMQPLSREYQIASGAAQRLRDAGVELDRYHPWNRRHAQQLLFRNGESEAAEVYQAFEQMYGVPLRDPMAYRPFVEFCLGLPVEMFIRDGEVRWLAKEMAKGIMPEDQRANRLNGRWDSDWLLRIKRRRADFIAEIDRLAKNERMAAMLDLPRMRAALEDLPDQTELDPQKYYSAEFAVPRGLLTARFVSFIEGRNEQ
ncbi:MAG: asparagine synthase-related protein [Sphingomicrobium sp.]